MLGTKISPASNNFILSVRGDKGLNDQSKRSGKSLNDKSTTQQAAKTPEYKDGSLVVLWERL